MSKLKKNKFWKKTGKWEISHLFIRWTPTIIAWIPSFRVSSISFIPWLSIKIKGVAKRPIRTSTTDKSSHKMVSNQLLLGGWCQLPTELIWIQLVEYSIWCGFFLIQYSLKTWLHSSLKNQLVKPDFLKSFACF